jgi:hypothetical protein
MSPKEYLEKFFALKQMPVDDDKRRLFDDFCKEQYLNAASNILNLQDMLMKDWTLQLRIADIIKQQVMIPNGTVGKAYEAQLDFKRLGWEDLVSFNPEGLEDLGLTYNTETQQIKGTPLLSGDFKIKITFKVKEEAQEDGPHEKLLPLIINPDPKSLWKNIPSDTAAPFWKEDDIAVAASFGDKHIVAASKRGRSHANVGSFRDDDFAFKHFDENGWSVVAVSDGAGSAKFSRQGSKIACNTILDYFSEKFAGSGFAAFDELIAGHAANTGADTQKKISLFIYQNLGGAAKQVHNNIEAFAKEQGAAPKDFHATLIFALVKKYASGYAVLSFGVGDCPVGLVSKDRSSVSLMNKLDVGEFGGGTRFITMPEIFRDGFATRFGFKLVSDFSCLMLMTDGIYDPKFEVEANLEKAEKWQDFIHDLEGNNADLVKVNLDSSNPDIATELSVWMDFWSPGNHDDRTLVIIF